MSSLTEWEFNRKLVEEYFKWGSVEEVYRKSDFPLPLSYASYQRVLDRWGVIKNAGSGSRIVEAIEFFENMATDGVPFEKLIKKVPLTFRTSTKTLYRIYSYIKSGVTRKVGTALVLTPRDNPQKILLARDFSLPSIKFGKRLGAYSLPMGYSRKRDTKRTNILRILQKEVYTNKVVNGDSMDHLISGGIEPFMYIDIADVRVSVYQLYLPREIFSVKNFFSYKLRNYKYCDMDAIINWKGNIPIRSGVCEIIKGYKRYLNLTCKNIVVNPFQEKSLLNKELASVDIEIWD